LHVFFGHGKTVYGKIPLVLLPVGGIQLQGISQAPRNKHPLPELFQGNGIKGIQRVTPVAQAAYALCHHVASEPVFVPPLKSVVVKLYDDILFFKFNPLQGKSSIGNGFSFAFFVCFTAVQREKNIFLVFCQPDGTRIGQGYAVVPPSGTVIVYHHIVQHVGNIVPVFNPEAVIINSVVKDSGGNTDFLFGA